MPNTDTLNKKGTVLKGTAPLNWCPICAHRLREENIQLKDGNSVYGMKCPNCQYINNPNFIQITKE